MEPFKNHTKFLTKEATLPALFTLLQKMILKRPITHQNFSYHIIQCHDNTGHTQALIYTEQHLTGHQWPPTDSEEMHCFI